MRPAAAVAALKGKGQLIGLVRMVQASAVSCVVEATLDGLPAGEYAVNIHELGDLSDGGKRYRLTSATGGKRYRLTRRKEV